MNGRILTFADLLAPVQPETFFEQHWENQPLHIQRSAGNFYENLLTNRDVEAAISSGGLRYPVLVIEYRELLSGLYCYRSTPVLAVEPRFSTVSGNSRRMASVVSLGAQRRLCRRPAQPLVSR